MMKTGGRAIWSVPAELPYIALFGLLVVLGIAWKVWREVGWRTDDGAWETIDQIIIGAGQVGIAAATCTACVATISEATMILAERYKARRYAEGRATGLATGLAEGHATGLAEGHATGLAEGHATGLAEGRATGLAQGRLEAVEVAIRQTTREIDPGVEVTTDASQWFEREVMRVTLTKSGGETEWFEVTMEQALSPDLRPLLDKQLASLG